MQPARMYDNLKETFFEWDPGKGADHYLFIDYLRNGRGTTAIGTWSPRARRGFPIARPVAWTQVERSISPSAFSMTAPEPAQSDRKPATRRKR
jgi:DNA primase